MSKMQDHDFAVVILHSCSYLSLSLSITQQPEYDDGILGHHVDFSVGDCRH